MLITRPRPVNIYEVHCERCGGFLGLQRDAFRSETSADGRKRYWHLPACPIQEANVAKIKATYNKMVE